MRCLDGCWSAARRFVVVVAMICLGSQASAAFLKVDPDDPLEAPWESKGWSSTVPLVVFVSGGGGAQDKDRRGRAAKFDQEEVVIYKPDSATYSRASMRPLEDFLKARRGVLGKNLHFLVSSAGVTPFEKYVFKSNILPAEIGGVALVQPFSPRFLTDPFDRPVLDAAVIPVLHVVYDIRMPDPDSFFFRAGPSRFPVGSTVESDYVLFGYEENKAGNTAEVVCQHSKAVGLAETLATTVLKLVMRVGLPEAKSAVQTQRAESGLGQGFGTSGDPLARCLLTVSECEDEYWIDSIMCTVPTGDPDDLVRLGWGPSINDAGDVAFRMERHDGAEAIAVRDRDATTVWSPTGWAVDAEFGDMVQMNNSGQVVWRDFSVDRRTDTPDGLLSQIIVGVRTAGKSKIVARQRYDRIDTPEVDFPSAFGRPLFDPNPTFSQGVSINNGGRPVFGGRIWGLDDFTALATPLTLDPSSQDFVNGYHLAGLGGVHTFYPMHSDNGLTVVQWGGAINSPLVVFTDETLASGESRAGSGYFHAIGRKPGISDDGRLIVFAGDHRTLGGGFWGLSETRGFKIAGMSGDGRRDPGERWKDLNDDGVVAPGEDLGTLINFSMVPRVCVNQSGPSAENRYTVAYLATGLDGKLSLFTSEVVLEDPSNPIVRAPQRVMRTGDTLDDPNGGPLLNGALTDLSINDGVNNRGELAAWVKTSGAQDAVLRAIPPVNEIDRWWGTAGGGAFPVEWRVRVCRRSAHRFVLRPGAFDGWQIEMPAKISVTGPGGLSAEVDLTSGVNYFGEPFVYADLPVLTLGVHTIRVRNLRPPIRPAVEEIRFQLHVPVLLRHVVVEELKTFFIADHPQIASDTMIRVRAGGVDVDETILQMCERFAPRLFFNQGEWFPYAADVEESTWKQQPMLPSGDAESEMNLSVYDKAWPLVGGQTGRIYTSVVRNDADAQMAINYWFHYPRSNWGEHDGPNTHEGDWEGVTVFFKSSGIPGAAWAPVDVAFGQHVRLFGGWSDSIDGGDRVAWEDVGREREHVSVYVGLGGHASYSKQGVSNWAVPCGFFADERHNGELGSSTHSVAYLGQVGSGPVAFGGTAPDWLVYPGLWGRSGLNGSPNSRCNFGNTAPRGPVFLGEGESAPGERWIDPWRWAETFRPPPTLVRNYLAWAATVFDPSDLNTGPDHDFSGDGLSNSLVQFLGLDPKANNAGKGIQFIGIEEYSGNGRSEGGRTGIRREMRLQTRYSKTVDRLMVRLSASSDLRTWSDVDDVNWLVAGEDATAWILESRVSIEAGMAQFYRVRFATGQ